MYKFLLLLFVIFSFPSFAGSKCQYEWDALKNIQSAMRSYSSEGGRNAERRLHKAYQDCRKRKNNQSSKTKKYVSSKKKAKKSKKPIVFDSYDSTISEVGIRALFQGEKQQAWLDYYRLPDECKKPKSTQSFSTCLNHRYTEAEKFDKLWREQNAPPSIVLGSN